jgi:UDP-3-O-[3-hydroxymyristoyl] N-acetylglucosamine deacetylase
MTDTAETTTFDADLLVGERTARTLGGAVELSGIGLHTGHRVDMRLCPAGVGEGIRFRRTDLPGQPEIPARFDCVQSTTRATTIGVGEASVHTVEHVLAALRAYHIDNAVVELSEAEPPVAGGCSVEFLRMIEEAGIEEQAASVPILRLDQPVYWSEDEVHMVALPAEEYRISYTLHYPHSPALRSQYFSLAVDSESFKRELAPCRSFALYEEVEPLLEAGLIKGTSLESGVVIKGEAILSKEGLRFPDEMVRHKVLDVVGDLALLGVEMQMHVIAIRAGHTSNTGLGKELMKRVTGGSLE